MIHRAPALMPRNGGPRGPALDLEEWASLPEDEPGELVGGHLTQEEAPDPLEVFELDAGRYTKVVGATAGQVADIPACEGLVVDLDELWTELERLGPDDAE